MMTRFCMHLIDSFKGVFMTLRKCSCGKIQTTKNSKFIGEEIILEKRILFFTCKSCNSTFILKNKKELIKHSEVVA